MLAVLGTTALLVVHVILAQALGGSSSGAKVSAIISAVLEAFVLILLCWCFLLHLRLSPWDRSRKSDGPWFGLSALLCTVAAETSVAALVCLSNSAHDLPTAILGSSAVSFLIGASVALGLAFAA